MADTHIYTHAETMDVCNLYSMADTHIYTHAETMDVCNLL